MDNLVSFVIAEKKETIEARVRVEKDVWLRIKAKAALRNIPVADFVGEILSKEAKGLPLPSEVMKDDEKEE